LWVADSYKRRIAHYSEDGSFIEAIPTGVGPADLAFVGERLYVLFEEGGRSIAAIDSGVLSESIALTAAGKPPHVLAFVGHQDQLLAWFTDAEGTLGRFWAIGVIDPVSGHVTAASGINVAGELFMDLVPILDTRPLSYDVRWSEDGHLTRRQEIRFQLVRGSSAVRISVSDTFIRTSTPIGVATLVNREWPGTSGRGLVSGNPDERWPTHVRASPGGRVHRRRHPIHGSRARRCDLLDAPAEGWPPHLPALSQAPRHLVNPRPIAIVAET
jgi:hypothetical protein